jgi:hypothetical protein
MTKTSLAILFLGTSLCACAPQTEVINYRTYTDPDRGIFYIVDGQVLDRAALISGVGGDQQRVVITRQAN